MKKLLFSTLASLLFISANQASVLPVLEHSTCNAPTECSTQISVTSQSSTSLNNLTLENSQQVLFTDGNGSSFLVSLSVNHSFSSGNTLQIDFSTTTNLNNWLAVTDQQLEFVHSVTGATTTVDFIIIEQIIH